MVTYASFSSDICSYYELLYAALTHALNISNGETANRQQETQCWPTSEVSPLLRIRFCSGFIQHLVDSCLIVSSLTCYLENLLKPCRTMLIAV